MLQAMTTQAADYLFLRLDKSETETNTHEWYQRKKNDAPEIIFPFLVESSGLIEQIYIIEKQDSDVFLSVSDMKPELEQALPFVKPSGSQGAQVGPVLKRTYDRKKGASPSPKILNTTMKYFQELAEKPSDWSKYFQKVLSILSEKKIKLLDGEECDWNESGYQSMLECVVNKIGQTNGTVFITVRNAEGKLPGFVREYQDYLMTEVIAGDRYLTGKISAIKDAECPLCGKTNTVVYPNALKGSGINLTNMDRVGRFPGLSIAHAWKNFSLCADCADLLYIYKNHVIQKKEKNSRRPFTAPIAGEMALIIPDCISDTETRLDVWESVKDYTKEARTNVDLAEDELLYILKEQKGILNLTFLWCSIGQSLEKVTGILTDVPPSRLMHLSKFNEDADEWDHPVFPEKILYTKNAKLKVDLSLGAFRSLFWRPGGKKAPNATRRLSELRRLLAAEVYHGQGLPEKYQTRLWDEILVTAQWWWLNAINSGSTFGLMNQGKGKEGKEDYLTAAGWIRHWAWWLYYFKRLGVLKMEKQFYKPDWTALQIYLGDESGIQGEDCKEKAFAFLLGVVFGRLMFIQETAGYRVSVLSWVKRFNIDGTQLPSLYKKTTAKLKEYQYGIQNKDVTKLFTKNFHMAIEELSLLGNQLGNEISLSTNLTGYYMLLGISLSNKILKKEEI